MSCQEAQHPPSLLLSLWHSSCPFRRGGCLFLCSLPWVHFSDGWWSSIRRGSTHSPFHSVSVQLFCWQNIWTLNYCCCSGENMIPGEGSLLWARWGIPLLAQISALMWLQLGLAFTEVKASAFSFLLLVPKWIDYVWDNRAWRSMPMLLLKQTFILQH